MRIGVILSFHEAAAVRLLNFLAQENGLILAERPDLPLLYDSGVVYRREAEEEWCDYLVLLTRGHEDCDGLAAARAGELLARGAAALAPGDPGYKEARRRGLRRIQAEAMILTRQPPNEPGTLYHCVVRYRVGGRWYRDDPSAKLGMYGGHIAPEVKARWSRAGVAPLEPRP